MRAKKVDGTTDQSKSVTNGQPIRTGNESNERDEKNEREDKEKERKTEPSGHKPQRATASRETRRTAGERRVDRQGGDKRGQQKVEHSRAVDEHHVSVRVHLRLQLRPLPVQHAHRRVPRLGRGQRLRLLPRSGKSMPHLIQRVQPWSDPHRLHVVVFAGGVRGRGSGGGGGGGREGGS